jgi:hypothetical protein
MHAGGDVSADDHDDGCGPADDQIAPHRLGIEETTLAASATATLIQALTTVGSEADMAEARRHNLGTAERAHPGGGCTTAWLGQRADRAMERAV